MLEIGGLIVYGVEGVCQVSEIISRSFAGNDEKKDYYVMVPVHNPASKLYVPVDNEKLLSKIMGLLTYEQVVDLIKKSLGYNEWIADNKARSRYYKDTKIKYRGVEQLAARRAHNPKVDSSSLYPATTFIKELSVP